MDKTESELSALAIFDAIIKEFTNIKQQMHNLQMVLC
jgi:hypothetical protein